jgi:hypothetical protein
MAMTTAQAFDACYEAICEDAATSSRIIQRRDAVVAALVRAFPSTSNMTYKSRRVIGSLGRHTASKPFDDIDIMAEIFVEPNLWATKYMWNSSEFLYRVRTGLNNASTVQKIGARGQAVRLFYTDGLSVDVAAVVRYKTGGFGIPDGQGKWLTTNPITHEEYVDRRNSELGSNLKRFIVIVKQWNKAHSSRLSSFHLEMLAARTFNTLGSNRREALRVFFNHNAYNLSVTDPANYSGDLSSYLSTSERALVNTALIAARDRADLALTAEARGQHAEAIRLWRLILGPRFPVN